MRYIEQHRQFTEDCAWFRLGIDLRLALQHLHFPFYEDEEYPIPAIFFKKHFTRPEKSFRQFVTKTKHCSHGAKPPDIKKSFPIPALITHWVLLWKPLIFGQAQHQEFPRVPTVFCLINIKSHFDRFG
jgi:hypothetical protein